MSDRLATVSHVRGAAGVACSPADNRPADKNGRAEEGDPADDPRLAEVPGVAVENEPDPEAEHGKDCRGDGQRTDDPEAGNEAAYVVGGAAPQSGAGEYGQARGAAEPDHRR